MDLRLRPISVLLAVISIALAVPQAALGANRVVGACYIPDKPFPEFMNLWFEGWNYKDANGDKLIYAKPGMPLGGYAFVYFRNDTGKDMRVTDIAIQGIKMSEAFGKSADGAYECTGYNIFIPKHSKERIDALWAIGAPMWWKVEPIVVPPGAIAEIAVRLRRNPKPNQLDLAIISEQAQITAKIPVKKPSPRFETIAFSPSLDSVCLYPRHPKAGMKPEKVYLDGRDVTNRAAISADKSLNIATITLKLREPLKWMTYHNYSAVYKDGSQAIAGIRAWGRDMVYGMWGAGLYGGSSEEVAKRFLTDWAKHNINASMGMVSGQGADWYRTQEGWNFAESLGIGRMLTWIETKGKPLFFFLMDEPDACDTKIREVDPTLRLGSLGNDLVRWMNVLRVRDPNTPALLNIDNTYKPEQWYVYHQLPDIPCLDPYYQGELDFTYSDHPWAMPWMMKPTYVLGAATISQSAGAPKPLHVLLCSTKYRDQETGEEGRFPTGEEKRIEAYYTIAAGAKGLSYWWFSQDSGCIGCAADDPAARSMWKEIGLLGAELRTSSSVITTSCPISLPVKASKNLWVRSLLSGQDTVAVIAVNDDMICDRVGTVYKPVDKAKVVVDLPSWLKPGSVFEVTCSGTKDVTWKLDGGKLSLDLGTLKLSSFVVVTSNVGLRGRMQKLYEEKFAANVTELLQSTP